MLYYNQPSLIIILITFQNRQESNTPSDGFAPLNALELTTRGMEYKYLLYLWYVIAFLCSEM